MFKFLLLLVCLVVPACGTAAADTSAVEALSVGDSVFEVTKQGKDVVSAFKGGSLREAMAGAITLLLFLWRRFASKLLLGKLNAWQTGLVSAIVAFLAMLPVSLSAATFSWADFVLQSLILSAESMFLWQMVGKQVLPKVFGTPAVPPVPAPKV